MGIKSLPSTEYSPQAMKVKAPIAESLESPGTNETISLDEDELNEDHLNDGFREGPSTPAFPRGDIPLNLESTVVPRSNSRSSVLDLVLNTNTATVSTEEVIDESFAGASPMEESDFAGAPPIDGVLELIHDDDATSDRDFDGAYVGADKKAYKGYSDLSMVPPVLPSDGTEPKKLLIFVNGIRSNKDEHFESMEILADACNVAVVGVHNATAGGLFDVIQSIGDKMDWGQNLAVDSLADLFFDKIQKKEDVHVLGHSQGALVVSRAVKHLKNKLFLEEGMSEADVEQALKHINIETYGPACANFPDGPNYTHYVNKFDSVVNRFGLGRSSVHPGKGAKYHYFEKDGDSLDETHSFVSYVKLRLGLESANTPTDPPK